MTAATAAIARPQKITTGLLGSSVPRSDRLPITIEAASAPDTKKIATSSITSTLTAVANG
jgi:hypothetical protein